jgi:hypothetical protein
MRCILWPTRENLKFHIAPQSRRPARSVDVDGTNAPAFLSDAAWGYSQTPPLALLGRRSSRIMAPLCKRTSSRARKGSQFALCLNVEASDGREPG